VNGSTYTPLTPTATLSTAGKVGAAQAPADLVIVPGVGAGQPAQLAIAAFQPGGVIQYSKTFTSGPLGGAPAGGGLPVTPPNLTGLAVDAGGFILTGAGAQLGVVAAVPEPSTIALGVLGAAALLIRRRK